MGIKQQCNAFEGVWSFLYVCRFGLAGLLLLMGTVASAGPVYDSLSSADQHKIQNGEQVIYFDPIPGSIWFQARVYQRVEALPVEAAAVFFDYNRYGGVVHRIESAEVIDVDAKTPSRVTVKFRIHMRWPLNWFFGNPEYEVENLASCDSRGYQFNWKKVQSEFIRDIHGSALAEPLGNGTLIFYSNYVEPASPSMNLRIVSDRIKVGSEKALKSIEDRILSLKKNDPDLLREEVGTLVNALTQSGFIQCP